MFGKQTRISELYKDDACVSGPTKHSWFDCSGMIYDYHMVELCRNCCARIYARRLVVRDLLQAASCPMIVISKPTCPLTTTQALAFVSKFLLLPFAQTIWLD